MVSKLAKNIAHFFVVQKIVEKPKEAIYTYGTMKKATKFKRILSGVLSAVMAVSAVPIVSAQAEESIEPYPYTKENYEFVEMETIHLSLIHISEPTRPY